VDRDLLSTLDVLGTVPAFPHTLAFNFLYYFSPPFITAIATATMDIKVSTVFEDIPSAKVAIKVYLADAAELWKTTHSDKSRFCIVCKQNNSCTFRIRAISSKKKGISITHIEPYTYSPATHYSASNTNSLEYLIPYYHSAIIDNPKISPKQI
jgi:hypothetical protein